MARNMKLEDPRLSESNTLMELYWLDEFSFILRDNIFFKGNILKTKSFKKISLEELV